MTSTFQPQRCSVFWLSHHLEHDRSVREDEGAVRRERWASYSSQEAPEKEDNEGMARVGGWGSGWCRREKSVQVWGYRSTVRDGCLSTKDPVSTGKNSSWAWRPREETGTVQARSRARGVDEVPGRVLRSMVSWSVRQGN